MANNIISDWLFDFADGADIPEDDETYDYAEKLDRLVEAARSARVGLESYAAMNPQLQSEGLAMIHKMLLAALREIELKGEHGE